MEAGIPARRLWPLDFQAQCFVEPVVAASKRILAESLYPQPFPTPNHFSVLKRGSTPKPSSRNPKTCKIKLSKQHIAF